jgi:hypothetical protein
MRLHLATSLASSAIAVLCFAAACGPMKDSEGDSENRTGNIVGGTRASDHPEAVLVDMGGSACSGSVIAPRVVLTAGHCVDGASSWSITAPYAGGQRAKSRKGVVYDWKDVAGEAVDPDKHDLGLVILDTAITLTSYPPLQKTPLADGSKIVNIGRIQDGSFSTTDLFISKPLSAKDAKGDGFPFDYITSEVIQPGDSGGPVESAGTHTIVAVNSGAGGGTQVLARVDLVYDWIQATITANGGGGAVDPPVPVPDAGPPPPPPPPPPSGDSDRDGVGDALDLCGGTPAGATVWTSGEWIGCAAGQWRDGGGGADYDRDGVGDLQDRCRRTPAGQPVWQYGDWIGCASGEHRDF